MRIPTVSRFCFCCNLCTGNKVVAWIYLIIYLLVASFALISFIFEIDIVEFMSIDETKVERNSTYIYEVGEVASSKIEFFDTAGTMIICIFLAFVAFLFIEGINSRDPQKMTPFMIQFAIFSLLFLGAGIYFMIVYFLVKAIISLYIFICAFSLHQVFVFEKAQEAENDAEMRKYTEQVYGNVEDEGKYYNGSGGNNFGNQIEGFHEP